MDEKLLDTVYKVRALERARKIPSINYLWNKSTKMYDRMKETSAVVHWAFDMVENVFNTVIEKSLSTKLIEKPIYIIDKTLCQGLDYIEIKMPLVKEDPKQILNRTKTIVSEHLKPAVERVNNFTQETKHKVRYMTLLTYYRVYYIRVYSWQQADKVMSTDMGINILKTIDSTTDHAKLLLDKYLPPSYEELNNDEKEQLCCERAKLHHTVIRLNEFSSLVSRRICFAFIDWWQHMYTIEIFIFVLYALTVLQTIKFLELIFYFIFKVFNEYLFKFK
ncbi:lipid storage droplets surface-binding protein 2-like [Calliopsis andreniformis]|uniref:lipid storage droplets surface-binding protein 2-like n=1 Tax=Calliopsis andreniformis TaxID=337506 RepID=UPI003FCDEB2C